MEVKMQYKILMCAAVGLMAPLLFGSVSSQINSGLMVYLVAQAPACPPQVFGEASKLPYAVDMNQVVVDPASGQKLLLNQGPLYATAGRPWAVTGWACDPDSDLLALTAVGGALTFNPDGTYRVTGTAPAAGVIYVTMTLMDKPIDPTQALTRKGTWAIAVVPPNRPPSLCGGLP
jgi:hypothetical protein